MGQKVFILPKPKKKLSEREKIDKRKKYYLEHREEKLKKMKEYREANKEKISLLKKRWWSEHYVKKGRFGNIPVNRKMVRQYDLHTNELLGEYESITDASEDNRINRVTISNALNHKNGICERLGWRFEVVEVNDYVATM